MLISDLCLHGILDCEKEAKLKMKFACISDPMDHSTKKCVNSLLRSCVKHDGSDYTKTKKTKTHSHKYIDKQKWTYW